MQQKQRLYVAKDHHPVTKESKLIYHFIPKKEKKNLSSRSLIDTEPSCLQTKWDSKICNVPFFRFILNDLPQAHPYSSPPLSQRSCSSHVSRSSTFRVVSNLGRYRATSFQSAGLWLGGWILPSSIVSKLRGDHNSLATFVFRAIYGVATNLRS